MTTSLTGTMNAGDFPDSSVHQCGGVAWDRSSQTMTLESLTAANAAAILSNPHLVLTIGAGALNASAVAVVAAAKEFDAVRRGGPFNFPNHSTENADQCRADLATAVATFIAAHG